MTSPTPAAQDIAPTSQAASAYRRHPAGRQLFWFATGLILVSGVLLALALAYLRGQALQTAERLTLSFAHVVAEQTGRTIQVADQRLQLAATALAQLEARGSLNEASARLLLREQLSQLPFVRAIWVMDAQGRIVYESDVGNIGVNLADRGYFQIYRTQPQTTFFLGMPVRSRSTGAWLISASRPLRGADGSLAGIIVAALEPPYFDNIWRDVDLGPGGSIALLRRDGVLLARSPSDESVFGRSFADNSLFRTHLPLRPAGTFRDTSPVDAQERLFAYRSFAGEPELVVVVGQSYQLVLAPWSRLAGLVLAVWLAASLAVGLLCAFLNRSWQQRNRVEHRSRQLAERLELATSAASIGVWDWDLRSDQWYASPTYFTMLGYPAADGYAERGQWLERVHPEDRDAVQAQIQAMRAGADRPYQYEARLRHADGSYRWVSVVGRVLERDAAGRASRLLGVRLDIQERKLAEQALREGETRYRQLFENNPHPMWVYDLETLGFLAVNDAAVAKYGYSHAEFLAMTIRDIRPAEDVPALVDSVAHVDSVLSQPMIWRHRRRDGSLILAEITAHTLRFGDRPARLILAHDVTERLRAQEQLQRSEESLSITLQSIGDAVIATDAAGLVTRMNGTAERLTGWPVAQALGQPLGAVFRIINAQTRAPAINPAQLVMQHGQVVGLANHTALLARDGREYQIADSAAPIRSPGGAVVGVVLVFSDVTEQYRVRQALARAADLLERTGEMARVGGWELDLGTMQPYWSLENCRIHEVDPPVAPGLEQALDFYAPEAREVIRSALQASIAQGSSWDLELPMVTARGRPIWVRTQGFAEMHEGKAVRLQGALHDITERKLAQEALRLSDIALKAISQGVLIAGADRRILSANAAFLAITGYPEAQVLGRDCRFLQGPLTDSATVDAMRRALAENREFSGEILNYRQDGSSFWNELTISPVRDAQGRLTHYISVTRDVSARRHSDQALRASEQQLLLALRGGDLGLWDWNLAAGSLVVNARWRAMLGRDPDGPMPSLQDWQALVHPQDLPALEGMTEQIVFNPSGTDFEIELRVRHCSGAYVWILDKGAVVERAADGAPMRVVGTHLDITGRKLAEAALQLSEARFRSAFASAGVGMSVSDLEGHWLQVNRRLCEIVGYPESELLRLTFQDITYAEDLDADLAHMRELLAGTVPYFQMEKRYVHYDGHLVWINLTVSLVRGADGGPLHTVAHMEDISQRKRLEQDLRHSEARLQATLDAIPDMLIEVGLDGRYHDVRAPRADLLLAPAQQLLGRLVSEVMSADASSVVYSALQEAHALGFSTGRQIALEVPQGLRWFELSIARKSVLAGEEPRFIALSRDITQRKLAEAAVVESALHTQTILDNMADCVITIDARGLVQSFNVAASQVFGYGVDEVLGRNVSMLMPEPDRGRHDGYLRHHLETVENRIIGSSREVEGLRKDGTRFPMNLSVSRVARGGQTTFIGIVRDITQHRRDVEEIRRLAFYDLLTGLPNRRLLMDRLKQAMVTSARNGQHGALMFLDLDQFKQLNDSMGHDIGDVLLQQVGLRLQGCVREGDSVARLGGDEFVVLLEGLSLNAHEAANQAEIVANKVLEAFGQPFSLHGVPHESTPSIGIVVFLGDQQGLDVLLKNADVAMYQAKAAGRNTARFFDPGMQAAVAAHEALERDLRRGLAAQEFMLHYQIQVNGAGETIGVEALVRWNHPTRGLVTPAHFITLAEETGLILPLGQWVLETACAQLVAWAGLDGCAHWTMAVNVSALQFAQAGFVANVASALDKSGAAARLLKLELTESMLLDGVEDVIVKMNQIKAFGVGFSLDDFGTGYSSLSYLKRLPLDQLKIDQSFVRDILTDPSDAVIARTIVALGHSLGIMVIAEGVELPEQRDFLAQTGCDAFQGYLFGRPAAADSLLGQPDLVSG